MSASRTPTHAAKKDSMYELCEQMTDHQIAQIAKKQSSYELFLDPQTTNGKRYLASLNHDAKQAVELGVGLGGQLQALEKLEWKLSGYERSEKALQYLKSHKKNIRCQAVDFKLEDTYIAPLQNDLRQPTNIIIVNLLEHMLDILTQEPIGVASLLFNCIRLAAPGTVFFITNHAFRITAELPNKEHKALYEKLIASRIFHAGHIPSFFAPRTDFAILIDEHTLSYSKEEKAKNLGNMADKCEIFSEVFVVRKFK